MMTGLCSNTVSSMVWFTGHRCELGPTSAFGRIEGAVARHYSTICRIVPDQLPGPIAQAGSRIRRPDLGSSADHGSGLQHRGASPGAPKLDLANLQVPNTISNQAIGYIANNGALP